MSQHTIQVPSTLDFEHGVLFADALDQLPDCERYVVDFHKVAWIEPFSMLYVASKFRRIIRRRRPATFVSCNHAHLSYAAHMGFFRIMGMEFGREVGTVENTSSYLPINRLDFDALSTEAEDQEERLGETIQRHAGYLTNALIQNHQGDLFDTLKYCVREILRNVAEHSNSRQAYYCGQYWPHKHRVEVALLDEGDGISKSLSMNPHLDINSDFDAVSLSLLPGVSGKSFVGANVDRSDPWTNSGFGLYVTSQICRRGGSFFICSGQSGILFDGKKKKISTSHKGTALRLVIDTQNLGRLGVALHHIVREGENIAAKLVGMNRLGASAASKMFSTT